MTEVRVAAYVQVTQQMLDDNRMPTLGEMLEAAKREREIAAIYGPVLGPPVPYHCSECGQIVAGDA